MRFRLASADDDAQIRRLIWATPSGPDNNLVFAREPSYFAWAQMFGPEIDVVVGEHDGDVIALGLRAIQLSRINQTIVSSAQLTDLRIRPDFRCRTTLARGFQFVRQLNRLRPCQICYTAIAEQNTVSLRTVASGRAHLPRYRAVGSVDVLSIDLPVAGAINGGDAVRASIDDVPQIVDFLNRDSRVFNRYFTIDDFTRGRFRGLRPTDFFLVHCGQGLCGCIAAWDQSCVTQPTITVLDPLIASLKSAFDGISHTGARCIRTMYGAFHASDSPEIFGALLGRLLLHARASGYERVIIGLTRGDPRFELVAHISQNYPIVVYQVLFDADDEIVSGVPYFEPALA